MKYAGLLVMPAGFFLTIGAILLFPVSAQRTAFVDRQIDCAEVVADRIHTGDSERILDIFACEPLHSWVIAI